MAITKETGTGSASANSYVDETDLGTYATDRGVTLTASTDPLKAELLIKAMDFLESKNFIGCKNTDAQALMWPRYGAVIDGYYIDTDSIPTLLQEAQMEIAISIDGGVNPMSNVPRETIKEKVGDIEVEYKSGSRPVEYLMAAETKLDKLVKSKNFSYRV